MISSLYSYLDWRHFLEIGILAVAIYFAFKAFRSTRGGRIMVGLLVVLLVVTVLVNLLNLQVIGWLIARLAAFLAIALVVLFQPELRSVLARLGSKSFLPFVKTGQLEFLESLADTVVKLSNNRYGALFAIERGISLKPQVETGVVLNSEFSPELALSIFHPKTALHDGGMILEKDRVVAAACLFPVSQRELRDRTLGLRHRAALGLTEETDAVAVVVSEETGAISVCHDGELKRNLSPTDFRVLMESIFLFTDEKAIKDDDAELADEDLIADSGDRGMVSHKGDIGS